MNLSQFQELTTEQQSEVIYQHGVYVGKRKQFEQTMVLYQLGSFYIQISFIIYRCYIAEITVFDTTDILDLYCEPAEQDKYMELCLN